MLKIGITGGIGSGKSYICQILEKMGYAIFYSDLEAKKLMTQNKELIQQIKFIIGEHAYLNEELNKSIIRKFLYENEVNKEKLNALIHPFVYQAFEKWTNVIQKEIVFNESALLFETNSYKRFNKTILVTAPEEIRIERLIKRDSLNIEEIKKRFNTQLKDSIKSKKADYIIDNNDKELLIPQINKILNELTTN
jgi:dephospho-CoA kinase